LGYVAQALQFFLTLFNSLASIRSWTTFVVQSDRVIYTLLLAGSALWCALIILAPLCAATPGLPRESAVLMYQFFHRICHQIEGRSFHLLGEPLGVCIRCSAIYFSFLAGVALYPLVHSIREVRLPSRVVIVGLLTPVILDVLAGTAGLHQPDTVTRLVTGATTGLLFAFIIVPTAIQGVRELRMQTFTSSPSTQKGQANG
jgi:uncharacterized membrane protein